MIERICEFIACAFFAVVSGGFGYYTGSWGAWAICLLCVLLMIIPTPKCEEISE